MNVQKHLSVTYEAPVVDVVEVLYEGPLCHSKDGEGYDGGNEFDWEDGYSD